MQYNGITHMYIFFKCVQVKQKNKQYRYARHADDGPVIHGHDILQTLITLAEFVMETRFKECETESCTSLDFCFTIANSNWLHKLSMSIGIIF